MSGAGAGPARALRGDALAAALRDARARLLSLIEDLDEPRLVVPQLETINPPLWEAAHVGWFAEWWCVRGAARMYAESRWRRAEPAPSLLGDCADAWYDSTRVGHAERWRLPLLERGATLDYLDRTLDAVLAALAQRGDDDASLYFHRLALFHEDMHCEALAYLRQTLGYAPTPSLAAAAAVLTRPCGDATGEDAASGPQPRDVELRIDGGPYRIGAPEGCGFRFDNERAAHDRVLEPFRIARRVVTNGEFLQFVEDGGYEQPRWWSDEGRRWLEQARDDAEGPRRCPRYWRRVDGCWRQRVFERWVALVPDAALAHVSAHEAEAWCRWAGRRLPTEAEWEVAARAGIGSGDGVWEWTADPFGPYPGFNPDPYEQYSQPWFGTHRSVRGHSFMASPRLRDAAYRNFYRPCRDDIAIGFRSCAA